MAIIFFDYKLVCTLGSYEAISDTLGCDYIAKSILPSVEELLVDKTLSRQQFEVVVNLVKSLLKKVLDIRTRDLGMAEVGVGELVGSSSMYVVVVFVVVAVVVVVVMIVGSIAVVVVVVVVLVVVLVVVVIVGSIAVVVVVVVVLVVVLVVVVIVGSIAVVVVVVVVLVVVLVVVVIVGSIAVVVVVVVIVIVVVVIGSSSGVGSSSGGSSILIRILAYSHHMIVREIPSPRRRPSSRARDIRTQSTKQQLWLRVEAGLATVVRNGGL